MPSTLSDLPNTLLHCVARDFSLSTLRGPLYLFGVCHDEVDLLTGIEHDDLERVAVVQARAHSRRLEDLRRRKRQVFQFSGIQCGVIAVIHGQKRVPLFAKQDHMFAAFRGAVFARSKPSVV